MNIKERLRLKTYNQLNHSFGLYKAALTARTDDSHLTPAKIIKSTDKPLNLLVPLKTVNPPF